MVVDTANGMGSVCAVGDWHVGGGELLGGGAWAVMHRAEENSSIVLGALSVLLLVLINLFSHLVFSLV